MKGFGSKVRRVPKRVESLEMHALAESSASSTLFEEDASQVAQSKAQKSNNRLAPKKAAVSVWPC